jgi:hypothetical protein
VREAIADAKVEHTGLSALLEDAFAIMALQLTFCLALHVENQKTGITVGLRGFPQKLEYRSF